jgi:uncharacterized membrane protein
MMRHGGTYGYPTHMHDAGTSSVEWVILGLAIAILVVVTLLLLDACLRRRQIRRFRHSHDEPLAIVRLRYARGEIAHDEYSQALTDLGTSEESAAALVEKANTKAEEDQPKRRRGRR